MTLWSIEDSSADFMGEFYRLVGQGLSLSQALHQTKLGYMGRTRPVARGVDLSLSHPFFWAPFTLCVTSGH
jgi:CHAT domain-containing protein